MIETTPRTRLGRWTRRSFPRRALGLGLIASGAWMLKRVFLPRRLRPSELETFAAFVDTLIPGATSPEAAGGGLVESLLAECQSDRQRRRALVEGVQWLDRAARQRREASFVALDRDEREAVVAEMESAEEGTLTRFFYRIVRDPAMRLHYARAAVWKQIAKLADWHRSG